MKRYAVSKASNYLHSGEFARRYADAGIVSVALNPGNLDSDLWRTQGSLTSWFLRKFVLHPSVNGAYTELFAGLAPEVAGRNGSWVVPFGRFMPVTRDDLVKATKTREDGGSGVGEEFWKWNEEQVKPFL